MDARVPHRRTGCTSRADASHATRQLPLTFTQGRAVATFASMTALDALLAPFLMDAPPPEAGPERPFGFEPFAMPVRAFAATLAGYEAEVADLEAMDAPPTPPVLILTPDWPYANIDTLALAEQGANATTQLAALLRGLQDITPQTGGPVMAWRCGLGADVWENLALIRAGKGLVRRHFIRQGRDAFLLGVRAAGRQADMTAADGYTNLLRLTTVALTAHAAGVDTLYLPEFAANAPGLDSLRERIHQVIEHESRVHSYGPAQQGAYWPTLLACRLMRAAEALAASGQGLDGVAATTQASRRAAVEAGTRVWVGQTKYTNEALTIPGPVPLGAVEWGA